MTVGGKAAVQIWLNNFTDTDCGTEEKVNPYYETWFSLPVTKKDAPLDLPYESPASYAVADPRANVFVMRVICGVHPGGDATQPMSAISGGREVWGFPKHHKLASIRYDYDGANATTFSASHLGKPVLSARVRLPESTPGHVVQKQEVRTAPDTAVTPRWSPKQTRYGEAFMATLNVAPWDKATDNLEVHGQDEWYGKMLKRWNFAPALKAHSTDFKIVAFKPAGWLGPK